MAVSLVQFELAHPLATNHAVAVGLEPRKYEVNETLTLPRQFALQLVAAGYVSGAEPGNPETVARALRPAAAPAKPAKTAAGSAEK